MTEEEQLIKDWLKNNEPTICGDNYLNRDTISVCFDGSIKRKITKRNYKLLTKQLPSGRQD
jgi:hypothetical protein